MSRIDDLINGLAPQGVPVRALADLGTIFRGKRFVKSDLVASGVPCIHYGEIYTKYGVWSDRAFSYLAPAHAARLRKALPGDVIIASAGETVEDIGKGFAWLGSQAVVIHDACYAFRSQLNPKYVSYYLQTDAFHDQIRRNISTSKISSISTENLGRARMPIPPLAVQREIVRVLDQFTALEAALEAELEAELEARRVQHAHYRRQLLTIATPEVRWSRLGEIAEVRSGWGFPHKYQGQTVGDYPFYKVSDMNLAGNKTVMTMANNWIDREAAKKLGVAPAPAGTLIFPKIGAAIATNKKRLLSMDSAYDNNVIGVIPRPHVESRFLFHWMQLVDLTRLAHDSGAVPSIRKTDLEDLEIPVPPPDEQRRVSALLDKFEALVNDLSSGLPAELNARRQQYEYYRDRLLTFKELAP